MTKTCSMYGTFTNIGVIFGSQFWQVFETWKHMAFGIWGYHMFNYNINYEKLSHDHTYHGTIWSTITFFGFCDTIWYHIFRPTALRHLKHHRWTLGKVPSLYPNVPSPTGSKRSKRGEPFGHVKFLY